MPTSSGGIGRENKKPNPQLTFFYLGMEHGTLSTYNNHKCHCDACKRAHTVYYREYLSRRYKNGRRMNTLCKFDGCEKKAIMDNAGLCYAHHDMLSRLIERGIRTKEEVELAFRAPPEELKG